MWGRVSSRMSIHCGHPARPRIWNGWRNTRASRSLRHSWGGSTLRLCARITYYSIPYFITNQGAGDLHFSGCYRRLGEDVEAGLPRKDQHVIERYVAEAVPINKPCAAPLIPSRTYGLVPSPQRDVHVDNRFSGDEPDGTTCRYFTVQVQTAE